MSQQINLFNPIFLKQKKYFSAITMAQALGLILAGSLVLTGYTSYRVSRLGSHAALTTAQLTTAQAQLDKLKGYSGTREKNKTLEDDVQRAEAQLKSLRQVFETLDKGELGNTKGYSEYLRAFARQIPSGIWLTGFSIHGAGAEIGLQGRALQPDLVPAYINRLKQEPVMQGKSFATLEMQMPEVDQGDKDKVASPRKISAAYIEFSLRSSGLKSEAVDGSGAKSR